MEEMSEKLTLAFLDMAVYVDEQRRFSSKCYQKLTDTGATLYLCSCAPLKRRKHFVEGSIHRLFWSTDFQATGNTLTNP